MQKHILLIDDDPDEFEFLLMAASRLPEEIRCSYAADTTEALSISQIFPPDCVFVDMNMPAVNGLQCIALLRRSIVMDPRVPIFIYSTSNNRELQNEATKAGAAGCIKKPTVPKDLVKVLEKFFYSHRA